MKTSKFVIFQSKKDNQWYWHLKSSNGKIVAQGEGYTRREDVLRVIHSMVDMVMSADIQELETKQ